MTKKINKIKVSFIGTNAEDVTGSMTLIETSNKNILLECGLYQSNSLIDDYKVNNRKLDFNPKNLDYIFIGHSHIDHIGMLPRLYEKGCTAKIIVPKGVKKLFSIMGPDSAYIVNKNYEFLRKKYPRILPIYNKESVDLCLKYFVEYDYNEKFQLDEDLKFRFTPSGHIISSAQTELWIKENNYEKKILYTSDLGNTAVGKFYVENFKPVEKANLVIGEATYSKQVRDVTQKDREKDLEKMKHIINNTISAKGRVLIPIFSLDRCQNLLTHLYLMFKDDKNFNTKILVDSPLAINLCNIYLELLEGKELELWQNIMKWDKIIFVKDYAISMKIRDSKESVVVLAASGFMQAGRSREWAKVLLPERNSHIIFVGFNTGNSLAGIIKEGKQHIINIDRVRAKNNCFITDLKSFSSHMQQKELLEYYSNINCDKIALVHGELKDKCKFAKKLQEYISQKNKTGRVISVNSGVQIIL